MMILNILIVAYFSLSSNLPGFAKNFPASMYMGVENKINVKNKNNKYLI